MLKSTRVTLPTAAVLMGLKNRISATLLGSVSAKPSAAAQKDPHPAFGHPLPQGEGKAQL